MNRDYAVVDKNKRKKEYLLAEIKDKGYDPEEYIEFLLKTKEGENLTLDDFSMSELQGSVVQFKFKYKKKEKGQFIPSVSKMGENVFKMDEPLPMPTKSHLKKKETVSEGNVSNVMMSVSEKIGEVIAKDGKLKEENKECVGNASGEKEKEKDKGDQGKGKDNEKNEEVKDKGKEKEATLVVKKDKEKVIEKEQEKTIENINAKDIEKKKEEVSENNKEKTDPKTDENNKEKADPKTDEKDKAKVDPKTDEKDKAKVDSKTDEKEKEINTDKDKSDKKVDDNNKQNEKPIPNKEPINNNPNDKISSKDKDKDKDKEKDKPQDLIILNKDIKDNTNPIIKEIPQEQSNSPSKSKQDNPSSLNALITNPKENPSVLPKEDLSKQPIPSKESQAIIPHQALASNEDIPIISTLSKDENRLIQVNPSITLHHPNILPIDNKTQPPQVKEAKPKPQNQPDPQTHLQLKKPTETRTHAKSVLSKSDHEKALALNSKLDDDLQHHSTGLVKQEKAFKPIIDVEAQKKKNEELYAAFLQSHETIQCQIHETNVFTNMKDIVLRITNPEAIKSGLFSTSYQYTLSCNKTDTEVTRRLEDFEWLKAKMNLLYPGVFIPPFPPNTYLTKNDSSKKVLYMERFMNALAELKLIRSSRIFSDFITLSLVDFLTVKKDYDKLDRPKELIDYKTMDGTVKISISKEQDARAMQISKDIASKSLLYDKLFASIDCLTAQFEQIALRFADVSKTLNEIQASYANSSAHEHTISKGFGQLALLMGSWEKGYNNQKDFFRDDVKYYFKFMQKELNTFNNHIEELKLARNNYNNTMARSNRKEQLSDKESKEVSNLQKMYGYYLYASLIEFDRLNKKQAKRFLRQFVALSDKRDMFFSDYNHFISLLNFEFVS